MHAKLSHLSAEEIQNLIQDYKDTQNRVSAILTKYNIDISPSLFNRILPFEKDEKKCPYCKINMQKKIVRRQNGKPEWHDERFCTCGHRERILPGVRYRCQCEGCQAVYKKFVDEKRQIICMVYKNNKPKIEFESLSVRDKINLFIFILREGNKAINEGENIANIFRKKRVENLLRNRFILVSPNSSLSAFYADDFPFKYNIGKVDFDNNVIYSKDVGEQILRKEYFLKNCDHNELLRTYWEILAEDALAKFEGMLRCRRLDLHVSDAGYDQFVKLFGKISYAQVLYLCNKVAVYFSDMVLTGKMKKYVVKNTLLSNVIGFYDRAMQNQWEIKNMTDYYISEELFISLEYIMNRDSSFLLQVPNSSIFE